MSEEKNLVLIKEIVALMIQMRKAWMPPLKLPACDVSPIQMMVLGAVEQGRILNMTQLATEVAVSNQQLTGLVEGLVAKGYVERTPNPKNRRANLISITPEGQSVLNNHHEQVILAIYPHMGEIPQEDYDKMLRAIIEVRELIGKNSVKREVQVG